MAVNVLGLDLSLTATGITDPDGTYSTVVGAAGRGDMRLYDVVAALHHIRETFRQVDVAVIEDLMTHSIGRGSQTALVHGAVRLYLIQYRIPYVLIPATTLKIYATGSGKADKHAMRMAAFKRAGLEFPDDNQADAWWLWHAGHDHYGHPTTPLPAAQRARLDKIVWPDLTAPQEHL